MKCKAPVFLGHVDVAKLIHEWGWSMAEAKRLVSQGAVEIDEVKVGRTHDIYNSSIVKVGKRFIVQLDAGIDMEYEKNGDEVRILSVEERE